MELQQYFLGNAVGYTVNNENITGMELNFEEIKAMADKLMYADKDEYYRRTGKDRRRV